MGESYWSEREFSMSHQEPLEDFGTVINSVEQQVTLLNPVDHV